MKSEVGFNVRQLVSYNIYKQRWVWPYS